ncbi:MAG: hypothetical protein ACP6IS_11475 [Candidatus Asgardarchaeia archaeon]
MFLPALMQINQGILVFGIVGALLIGIVLVLVLATIFLWIALKIVGGTETSFGHTFVTALLIAIVSPIPILGLPILQWYFIKSRHDLGWIKAIIAWIIAGLIPIIIVFGVLSALGLMGSLLSYVGMGVP